MARISTSPPEPVDVCLTVDVECSIAGTFDDPTRFTPLAEPVVECRVNGELRQSSNTVQFVFDVYDLVEYISDAMTLRPGDVISTGTPGGVGIFADPPNLLEPGDTVECEIEGIGVLQNRVVE